MAIAGITEASFAASSAAMRAGAVDVDFDLTVVGQIALFLILLAILKPVLFDPMLKLFEEREKRIEGRIKKGRDIDNKSAEALAKYEARMNAARAEGNAERDRLRAIGQRAEADILAKVRASTGKTLDEGRKSAQSDLAAVRTQLHGGVGDLARDIASRALGREVQG